MSKDADKTATTEAETEAGEAGKTSLRDKPSKEVGGREGLEPTRYGDWEVKGICVDF